MMNWRGRRRRRKSEANGNGGSDDDDDNNDDCYDGNIRVKSLCEYMKNNFCKNL